MLLEITIKYNKEVMAPMARKTLALAVIVLIMSSQRADAIRVMGIVSIPLKSHYMAFKPLFLELARRGHQVTVLSNYPNSSPVDNFKDVDLTDPNYVPHQMKSLAAYDDKSVDLHNVENFYNHIIGSRKMAADCVNLLTNEDVKKLVESGMKFDVIITEQFMSDCGLLLAAAFYDEVPIIGITSHVLLPWTYSRIGLHFSYSSDAFYFSPGGHDPLLQKLQSLLMGFYFNTFTKWIFHREIKSALDQHVPDNNVDVESVTKNMRMIFSYQHFSLTGARNLAPQILEIGGMHIGKPKPLPSNILAFINSSNEGVIYFSYGSNLRSSTLSDVKLQAFLDAFNDIPQKIIWKLDNVTILEGRDTSKIMAQDWFPQLDILCHPKVIGFVSHGGMLGTTEALNCGVPMIATPFFGDQFANSASIRESGLGIQLFYQDITRQTLLQALKDITSEKRRNHVEMLTQLWHDRPQSPLDSAVYWTEFVARYQHSPPQLNYKNASVFEQLLLDCHLLITGILLSLLGMVYILARILKYLVICLTRTVICKRKIE